MSDRIRLAVLAGGRSSEHEISLASAASVAAALDPARYDVRMIEIGRDGRWALPAGETRAALPATTTAETLPVPADSAPATLGAVDVVLPILHGPFGEDGTVQGLCELAGVAYVGPGVLASSVCMDKDVFKTLMRGAGIPVARHVALRLGEPVANPFGYPVFVKPANMGSSVGISKVRDESELDDAVARARRHDEKVMVEEFVDGTEIEVGVLGNLPSPVASLPGQVVSLNADWYDYSSKYDEGGSELVVPPPGLERGADRAGARARRRGVRGDVVRGDGPRRLLRPRLRRRGRDERAQHDPGLHVDELLLATLRGFRHRLRGASRPPRRAGARAPRAAQGPRVLRL